LGIFLSVRLFKKRERAGGVIFYKRSEIYYSKKPMKKRECFFYKLILSQKDNEKNRWLLKILLCQQTDGTPASDSTTERSFRKMYSQQTFLNFWRKHI
jgi:hypothetical protein